MPTQLLKSKLFFAVLCCASLMLFGCSTLMKELSNNLTQWQMLDQKALDNPIQAVGGDGIVFTPGPDSKFFNREQLARADAETLVSYYSPIFVQQRVNTQAQKYPYPQEYDMIGQAHLKVDSDGKLKSYVSGEPKVYVIMKKLKIDEAEHTQLTYTAWYPAHPRMKAIDLSYADIDSCVVRITLDQENVPLFFETIAACGCFHKVFVEKWLEVAAQQTFGPPEKGKKFSIEKSLKDSIDWEVGGVIDEPKDSPHRPVVFLKAGDHKVLGMGSAARLKVPTNADQHKYVMTSYADLYSIPVDNSDKTAAFFDMDNGGKVRGAERKKEKFFLSFVGVDSAGQPRADDQIKMHFDESTWGDPSIYSKYLRLPPGTLNPVKQVGVNLN